MTLIHLCPAFMFRAVLLLAFFLPSISPFAAEETATTTVSTTVNKDQIDAFVTQIQDDKTLTPEEKDVLLSLAETAKNRLNDSVQYREKIAEYNSLANTPLEETKPIQPPDEQFEKNIQNGLSGLDSEKLEIRRIQAQNTLTTANFGLKDIETRLSSEANAGSQESTARAAAQQRLANNQTELEQLQTATSTLSNKARIAFLNVRLQANLDELEMLKKRALTSATRKLQINRQLDNARAEVARATSRLRIIESEISRKNMNEADKIQAAIAEAQKQAEGKPEVIRDQITKNATLSSQLSILLNKTSDMTRQKERIQGFAQDIRDNFTNIQKRLQVAGLNTVLGEVLRKQDRQLASIDLSRTTEVKLKKELEWAGIRQINIDDRRNELEEVPGIKTGVIEIPDSMAADAAEKNKIGTELFVLMQTEKDLLSKLEDSTNTYLRVLEETSFERQQLVQTITEFRTFLDQHLLWTPSAEAIGVGLWNNLLEATTWLIKPASWLETANDLYHVAQQRLPLTVIVLISIALLILTRPFLSKKISLLGVQVSKLYTDKFQYTLIAMGYLLLIHLPAPIALFTSGWLLTSSPDASTFSVAVGHGLKSISVVWFLLNYFFSLYRTQGIVAIHLQWSKESLRVLRTQLILLRVFLPPLLFVVFMTASQGVSSYSNSLGRLAFVFAVMLTTITLWRLTAPKSGALQRYYQDHSDSSLYRIRYLVMLASVAIPLIIVGFAIAGYYASALELQRLFMMSVRIVFITILIQSLALRMLNLSNRRLAIRKAREKREAAKAEKQAAANIMDGAEGSINLTQEEIDIPTINEQTKTILNTFVIATVLLTLWAVWADLFPALSVTDQFTLWQTSYLQDNETITDNITLSDLFTALVYVILSTVIIRNLPGILELFFFQNISLDTGSRYAITSLLRYALIAISIMLITNQLGAHWQQFQWLVAALGVGLGFGLQEIFANMVSGIIILFERPIRVGDTVSVGSISGTVSRIQIRATTITDWDRKELIVPNKTFITEQLVNWTLTDPITRLVIPVGISYDSDVDLAQSIFKDVVSNHPLVLKDPPPQFFFLSFGDSSLDFEIRMYVKELANRLPLQNDIHFQLTKRLKENNIEIPFPQRDLHVRSMPDEWKSSTNSDHKGLNEQAN